MLMKQCFESAYCLRQDSPPTSIQTNACCSVSLRVHGSVSHKLTMRAGCENMIARITHGWQHALKPEDMAAENPVNHPFVA